MRAVLAALYSACVYAFFFVTFVYAIGFVENAVVPKSIDSGAAGDVTASVIVNLALLGLFAVQHSIMARPAFKRAWTKIVPAEAERSTYVLFATAALALLMAFWRPLPATVWRIEDSSLAALLIALSYAGWVMVLVSTFLISHFQLFGLSQGFAKLLGRTPGDMPFSTPGFYRFLRHPIYAGFIIAFWSAAEMSVGRLLFATATTGYILIGIWFEERDLVAQFGERYTRYRAQVGMLVPRFWKRLGEDSPKQV